MEKCGERFEETVTGANCIICKGRTNYKGCYWRTVDLEQKVSTKQEDAEIGKVGLPADFVCLC